MDTLIMRYYARNRPIRPQTLYRLARSILERTENLWIDPARSTHIEELIDMLLNPKLPVQSILQDQEKAAQLVPITLPSRSWFYQYLRWFEHQVDGGKAVINARYGQQAWEREHMVFDTFVTRATMPLQYVFADHWLLDLFTVDDATRSQTHRLWLTVLLDAYSRSTLGMALLYEAPSIMSIQSALQHAIYPKQVNHDLAWVCYGIPQQLYLDNAWAHHSYSLEDLARSISQNGYYPSIDLVFRPPYKGRYGALIERFFGNLSAQVKEHLPGAIVSRESKQFQSALQTACLLYDDVYAFLKDAIIEYQHTPHQELDGMTPHQKWLTGMNGVLPLVPPMTEGVRRLFWRMSPETRPITAKGINAFGMSYWSPDLGRLERINKRGQQVAYSFRYDPQDISCIALFRDGQWVGDVFAKELRHPDGSTQALSLWERDLAKQLARNYGESGRDWLHYLSHLDELSAQRQREKRQFQRQTKHRIVSQQVANPKIVENALDQVEPQSLDYNDLLKGFLDG